MDLEARKIYQNKPGSYTCQSCNSQVDAPRHCGHHMYVEVHDDGAHWICWMGAKCGDKMVDTCCDTMDLKAIE
ncbi:MAG: hypothetical protein INQ03_18650 [Candidatus Heimdallarchaeota archaeon]|nr:hypothetical protein [Candidatus Heimdallarchaeota archaeon]